MFENDVIEEYGPSYYEGLRVKPSQYDLDWFQLPAIDLNGILSSNVNADNSAERAWYTYNKNWTKTTLYKQASDEFLSIQSLSGYYSSEKEKLSVTATKWDIAYVTVDIPNDNLSKIKLDFTKQDQEVLNNGTLSNKMWTHISFGDTGYSYPNDKDIREVEYNEADWRVVAPKLFTPAKLWTAFNESKKIVEALMLSWDYGPGLEDIVPQIIDCLDKFQRDSLEVMKQI